MVDLAVRRRRSGELDLSQVVSQVKRRCELPYAVLVHRADGWLALELSRLLTALDLATPVELFVAGIGARSDALPAAVSRARLRLLRHSAPDVSHPITVFAGCGEARRLERELAAWHQATRDRFHLCLVPAEDLRIHECEHLIGAHVNDHLLAALPQPASTAATTSEDRHEHPTR